MLFTNISSLKAFYHALHSSPDHNCARNFLYINFFNHCSFLLLNIRQLYLLAEHQPFLANLIFIYTELEVIPRRLVIYVCRLVASSELTFAHIQEQRNMR